MAAIEIKQKWATVLKRVLVLVCAVAVGLCAQVSVAVATVDQSASGSNLGIQSISFSDCLDIDGEWAVSNAGSSIVIANVSTLETRTVVASGMTILGRTSPGAYDKVAIGTRGVVWSESWRLSSYEVSTSAYTDTVGTDISSREMRPSWSGDWLLFTRNADFYATIYAMNMVTGQTRVVSDSSGGLAPKTDGRYGVWLYSSRLTIMDLTNGNTSFLWVDHTGRVFAIDAGRVLYYEKVPTGYELRVWDIASSTYTPVVVTGSPWEEADLSGDWVTWQATGNAVSGLDIVAKNIATGEVRAVCRAVGNQSEPRISGDTVVWKDPRFAEYWPGVGFARLSDSPALDETAPALSLTPTVRVTSATIRVASTDAGSGVRRIGYRDGTGAPSYVTSSTAALVFNSPGAHDLVFWAEDMQGNTSAESTCSFFLKCQPVLTTPIVAKVAHVGRRVQVVSVVRGKSLPRQGEIRFRLAQYSAAQGAWVDRGYVVGRAGAVVADRYSARVRFNSAGRWRVTAVSPEDANNGFARSFGSAYISVK